ILAIAAFKIEQRKWVRNLALGVLGAVILQGILGGLRVVLVKLHLVIIHACFAQAFFCLTALMAAVTSKWCIESNELNWRSPLVRIGAIAVAAIYIQLILGALMRHNNAGLAIPDFPANYGHILPPANQRDLKIANDWRIWHGDEAIQSRVTLAQIW